MFEKLSFIEKQHEELAAKISDPAVMQDMDNWRKLCKEHSDMTPIVEKYKEYKANKNTIDDAEMMLDDPDTDKEFKEMLNEEIKEAKSNIERIEEELKILLLPKDPNDDKNVIVEIRGGAGGDEAALFAADLYRMYTMYAESKRWKTEIIARILPEMRDIVRKAKLIESNSRTDQDSYNWNKIKALREYLAKDSIDKKSLFTRLTNALNSGDFATASKLQVETYNKIEELKQLYDEYVRNNI